MANGRSTLSLSSLLPPSLLPFGRRGALRHRNPPAAAPFCVKTHPSDPAFFPT